MKKENKTNKKNNSKKNENKLPKGINFKIPKNNNNNKPLIFLIIFSLLFAFYLSKFQTPSNTIKEEVSLNQFIEKFETGTYSNVLIDGNKAIATLGDKLIIDGIEKTQKHTIILPQNDSLNELGIIKREEGLNTNIKVKDNTSAEYWRGMMPTIIILVLFILIAVVIISRMGGMANNAMSFGKSKAKIYDKSKDKVLFKDVAGAEEEKEELTEVVDFLKNPKKYKNMGAKIPKGILLVGPPGTGKTLIARAVAGESEVPFLSISGSEFVEMFVGVGASRVRDLFEQAKKLAPAIIFIDEIDAIGKKRGPGTGGGHDEREQTLNQILTEMDGFTGDSNIIVMGATNRADVLDKALLRPGRFDRKVTINLPNINDREKILKVHARGKKISNKVDFKSVASSTVGFSGADLDNLMNESALLTARKNQKEISQENIQLSLEKILMGLTKKSQVMNEDEKKITAYHEVGHALVGKLLPNTDTVHKVSIISRGGALGVTWFLPDRDTLLTSKAKYLDELATLYGGRAAEEIFFGKDYITTGASNDIERATKIARNMVTRFGMDEEIGAENFASEIIAGNYLGAEGATKPFSDKTQELIDLKVKQILDNAYKTAIKLINENKDLHIKISEKLLEVEEINKEEFNAFFA